MDVSGGFSYQKGRVELFNHSVSFSKDPSYLGSTVQILDSVRNFIQHASFMQDVINISQSNYYELTKNMNYNFGLNLTRKLPCGDDLDIGASFRQDKNKNDKATQELITYPQEQDADRTYRHLWEKTRTNGYSLQGSVKYTVHALNRWNYRSFVNFDYSRTTSDAPDYRLDDLEVYGPDAGKEVTDLPSTRDSLARTLDGQNSSWSTLTWHRTSPGFNVYYNKEGNGKTIWFEVNLPLDIREEKLNYRTTTADTTVRLQTILPEPMAKLEISSHNFDRFYKLQYNMNYNNGSLYNRVNVRNDANPLNIKLGNPDLKTALIHKFYARWRRTNRKYDQTFSSDLNVQFITNSIAYGNTYNPENGVRTYKYENVDGNWNAFGQFYFTRALGPEKRWRIQTNTSLSFIHNVDISATQGETGNSRLSTVDTWRTGEDAELSYRFKTLSVGINGTVDWRNSQSDRSGFETINAVEYNYGMTVNYTLPWKIQLATDIKMFSRRGYSDSGMNTDDVVWNASLTRSFAQKRLVVKLEGFDILSQISNTHYSIDAQGREEVWINNIPSYAMLHLQWRFNHMPKKK
ncbi:MAG: outer membrane beta-barrel family protein [Paraprevotella sp.]|nr:outer membrane beta-barrel family protein [Paraprevotella sp.]